MIKRETKQFAEVVKNNLFFYWNNGCYKIKKDGDESLWKRGCFSYLFGLFVENIE
jgi:hypothetical protein